MLSSRLAKLSLTLLSALVISSCSQDTSESEIAASIDLDVSSTVVVSPVNRSDESSCVEGGVQGPQVRIWASIQWNGVPGGELSDQLIPLAMYLKFDKGTRLDADYNGGITAIGDAESISAIFGVSDDYLSPSTEYHSSDVCFADYGGLPKPLTELTGNQQIIVSATIQLMGVLRRGTSEVPFIKEERTKIVYVAGSVAP